MVGRGARNLILLSRSGPKNDNATSLLKELNAVGARIEAPVCDVTKLDSVSSVLMQCWADHAAYQKMHSGIAIVEGNCSHSSPADVFQLLGKLKTCLP
jgi:hypothetical protein